MKKTTDSRMVFINKECNSHLKLMDKKSLNKQNLN